MSNMGDGTSVISNKKFKSNNSNKNDVKNYYNGYTPEVHPKTLIEELSFKNDIKSPEWFYDNFIKKRKPAKIILDSDTTTKYKAEEDLKKIINMLQINNILETLTGNTDEYNCDEPLLQVEKAVAGGFGSGERRLKMSFSDFYHKVTGDTDESLYLTTQYLEDDPDLLLKKEMKEEKEEEYSDYEETEEEDVLFPQGSDAGSFNLNDLHDDFEEIEAAAEEEEEEEEEEKEKEEKEEKEEIGIFLKDGPLTPDECLTRVEELYQRPLTKLCNDNKTDKYIPLNLEFITPMLIPQQINLWMGSTRSKSKNNNEAGLSDDFFDKYLNTELFNSRSGLGKHVPGTGISSGLHHDHADNIYIAIEGRKRFTLYSPKDATNMYTVGDIKEIYSSGIINYENNKNAPTWNNLNSDGSIREDAACYLDNNRNNENKNLDPPSFSKIPPVMLHLDEIHNNKTRQQLLKTGLVYWPKFFSCNKIEVTLKPGELLYLPTGWFHEVTSFGDIHIAVNYWFFPPNISSSEPATQATLYSDDLRHDFERTKASLEWYNKHVNK
ncbi:uncharacterized protein SCDLUD_003360 [Saccharomycodes ludwigii]|uniref:uncharacterized protein n=1 Tax=Saccharomycodes ludwigii TaxID=36035 RepID=UPI001E88011D|nr:hypothetical protein SCDLUD_003360 [Saccharomycodes ludwigii]KAH3900383.1 hypothetical protein SCDLUD_003360 [Saccharomycodes ludwigii]